MLSTNQVADRPEEFKLVTATIAAAGTTVTNADDVELVWGKILWIYATSSNAVDAFVESVTLDANGGLTVTVSSAMTAEVEYTVSIARATGNDA